MKELGVFCGTFNPIHWGHLLLAECARDQFDLYKVLFITSARPPHRRSDLLDGEKRHAMVDAAVADNPYFEASRLELDRPDLSYTVDTLKELKLLYGDEVHLSLIVGGDNISSLGEWHKSDEIFKLCRLIAAPRLMPPGDRGREMVERLPEAPEGSDCSVIDFPPVSVSSSEIRQRLRQGKSVLYMVPPAVNAILTAEAHYREISKSTAQND